MGQRPPDKHRDERRLDEEERNLVRDCLAKDEILLPGGRFEQFIGEVEAAINRFRADNKKQHTSRTAKDALRSFRERCRRAKPPVKVLRNDLPKLPKDAIEHLARHARVAIPRLCPGESLGDDVLDPPDRLATLLLKWAAAADDEKFLRVLRTGEGGRFTPGRSRGSGHRSRAKFELMVMGKVRGIRSEPMIMDGVTSAAPGGVGGRPTKGTSYQLLIDLVLAWSRATSRQPMAGRGDKTGFGALVYSVFQWLDVSGSAEYALRRYWDALKDRTKRFTSDVEPLVCADCRWVRLSTERDDFFCIKLAITCVTARTDGQPCGSQALLFERAG